MAVFNQDPTEQLNNSLNYSRGSTSSLVGIGNLFKDKADLIVAETNATKANIEMRVDDSVRQGITPIRDATIHALETGKLAATPEDVPSEVQTGLNRLGAMSEAKASGRLNESHYFNLLDAKAREIRAQYPGFRDYVDQRIAALTGANPANRLVAELYSEQKALAGAKSTANEYWLKQVYETGGKAEYDAIIKSGRVPTEGDLREIAMNRKAATVRVDNARKTLELSRDERTDTVAKYKEAATTEAGVYLDQMTRSATGPMKMFQQKLDEAVKAAGPQGKYKPEDLAVLNELFVQGKTRAKQEIQLMLTRQIKDAEGRPYTYNSKLTDDKDRKDIENLADAYFAPWEQAMYNKDYGRMSALASRVKLTQDGALDDLMGSVPHAKALYALQKTMGTSASAEIFWKSSNLVSTMAKLRYEDNMGWALGPDPKANLNDAASKAAAKNDKESTLATINEGIRQLSDPKLNDHSFTKMTNFMFSDKNKDFLTKKDSAGNDVLSTNDSYNLYTKMFANPAVVKNIVDRKNQFPDEYAKFRELAVGNFGRLMKTNANEANRLIQSSDRYSLTYDAKTGMFKSVAFKRDTTGMTGVEAFVSTAGSLFGDPASLKAVEQLNKTMLGVSQLIKAEGGDPLKEIPTLIKQLGINTEAGKQGFTGKVVDAMEKANPENTTEKSKTTNNKDDSADKPSAPKGTRTFVRKDPATGVVLQRAIEINGKTYDYTNGVVGEPIELK